MCVESMHILIPLKDVDCLSKYVLVFVMGDAGCPTFVNGC